MAPLDKTTELAQHFAGLTIKPGDAVIDATAGNGVDTFFLAKNVGRGGKVYSFDIQQEALHKTRDRLGNTGLKERVKLILAGHEDMAAYVTEKVSVVMYNLGYLPGGNKKITTKSDTSTRSLEQALNLLKNGGLVTIVLYPGHEEGYLESKEIISYASCLAAKDFLVYHLQVTNRPGKPPELLLIKKLFPGAKGGEKDFNLFLSKGS